MAQATAFTFLADFAYRFKQITPQLPEEHDTQATWSAIGFNVAGHRIIAPLGEIVEIIPTPNVTRLPGVQSWVLGVANVRGRLLPMFDLEAFLGGKLSAFRAKHRVLIIEMGELYAGLVVSEAYGMQYFPESLVIKEVPESATVLTPYSKGSYDYDSYTWITFSLYSLIANPRFFDAAMA